ncbi:MAG: glycosyltransferase family 2 protein [Hyphomicrobiales bacterium]
MENLQANTLITVIITHYNYSRFIEAALRSVLVQTHATFECVVVDDCSDATERERLNEIVAGLSDRRFRVLALPENKGQINAVFEGLKATRGEFVSLLDPDDRYAPTFLARLLQSHLNPCVYAATASCEMALFRIGGDQLTTSYSGFKSKAIADGSLPRAEASLVDFGYSKHYPAETTGWLWGTTSSMMFRRDALECLRRDTYVPDTKVHADTYCVYGAHMLGGTLFVDEVLSYRGLHRDNSAESPLVIATRQNRHRPEFDDISRKIRNFVMHTLMANGNAAKLLPQDLAKVLQAHFSPAERKAFYRAFPQYKEMVRPFMTTGLWERVENYARGRRLEAALRRAERLKRLAAGIPVPRS